jgi:7-cyano-7-deazaguanine synthase in queuosine biosynthesis
MNERFESQPFRLDEDGLCRQLTSMISPRMRDLLHIAMRAYVADRLTKRNGRADLDGPSRIMPPMTVRVSDPDFWNSQTVKRLLQRAIGFLGDDCWDFTFEIQHPQPQRQLWFALPRPEDTLICLYSGGLDSAAGLANRLLEWNGEVVAVTAQHQAGQSRLIRDQQFPRLRRRFGNRISSVMVRTTLRNPPPMNRQELTQRCRSFLFASLAGAVAFESGIESVEVYENGVGIINLPLMTGMLVGGRATKSAHPEFFRRMSELLSTVAERPIRFCLPFRTKTKAQLVKALADDGELCELARSSASCVHYPRRVRGSRKHCGVCPGCIGRRQALISAGIHERSDKYAFDIFGDKATVASIPKGELDCLKATITQIEALSCVQPDGRLPLAVQTHLARVVRSSEDKGRSIQLLQQYRSEWLPLIDAGLRAGRQWACWHGPIHSA